MLQSHPAISSPTGESQFFIPLYKNASKYGDLCQPKNIKKVLEEMRRLSPEFIEEDCHGLGTPFNYDQLANKLSKKQCKTMPQLIDSFLTENAIGERKSRWLDKTPYYILHMETLVTMFPDAQFIHIIRDGRDCAVSMMARKNDLRIYNVYQAAYIWNRYVSSGQNSGKEFGPKKYFELSYEKLVTDPKPVIKKLCQFLQEEYSEDIINFKKSRDHKSKTPLLSQPLQNNNTQKWQIKLSKNQIRIFEKVAGQTLLQNNYRVSTKTVPLPRLQRLLFEKHNQFSHWLNKNNLTSSVEKTTG